jgi:hypothetical protein
MDMLRGGHTRVDDRVDADAAGISKLAYYGNGETYRS